MLQVHVSKQIMIIVVTNIGLLFSFSCVFHKEPCNISSKKYIYSNIVESYLKDFLNNITNSMQVCMINLYYFCLNIYMHVFLFYFVLVLLQKWTNDHDSPITSLELFNLDCEVPPPAFLGKGISAWVSIVCNFSFTLWTLLVQVLYLL